MIKYGVNILGLIPLRKNPNDQSEMISQILFGQHFKIISSKPKWVQIITSKDNYEGWICIKQYLEINKNEYDNLSTNNYPIALDKISQLIGIEDDIEINIPMGSILPFFENGEIKISNKKFKFKGKTASKNLNDIINYSKLFMNSPYLWGGKSILGIDCSGFTQLIHTLCGIDLPRDAYQQAKMGKKIKFHEIMPGDLIFFKNESNKVNHVGISLESNQIIHASGKVTIDILNKNGILNTDNNLISHKYHSAITIK